MTAILALGLGGVCGAIARFALSERVEQDGLDTFLVNVLGSFALGGVLAAPVGDVGILALGTGFCGAFTTFSTFAVETVRLADRGRSRRALANATGTLAAALLAVFAGAWAIGAVAGSIGL